MSLCERCQFKKECPNYKENDNTTKCSHFKVKTKNFGYNLAGYMKRIAKEARK